MADVLKLSFKSNNYWSNIPVNYFLTIFCFILEEYDNAIKYLQSYMCETNCEKDTYYNSVLSLFKLYQEGFNPETQKDIPEEIINDFANRETLLKYIDLPSCPNCSTCKLQKDCQTRVIFDSILRISKKMRRDISQENLGKIFNTIPIINSH